MRWFTETVYGANLRTTFSGEFIRDVIIAFLKKEKTEGRLKNRKLKGDRYEKNIQNRHRDCSSSACPGRFITKERLHRWLLHVIKDEFDRRQRVEINSIQAFLLYNIGDQELSAGELGTRGYYLGSNVSYNLKKLVEMSFLDHQRSRVDRRSVRIKLTDKGRDLYPVIVALLRWGDRWMAGESGPPLALVHKSCGHRIHPTLVCPDCGAPLPADSPQALCPACLMRQALASRTICATDVSSFGSRKTAWTCTGSASRSTSIMCRAAKRA